MHEFPANPKNGTVFEIRRGLYYVYEASTKSWVRVAGAGQLFPLATPVAHGLMAAADLRKINRVLVPMPSSTIRGENCTGRFISGHIGLYSTDDYIKVTGEPLIKNAGVGGNYSFRISQNTAGFDFTIDKSALVAELIARGQINLVGPPGKQGQPGLQGRDGGALATGPRGPKGDQGTAPDCTITVTPDTAPAQIKDGANKAVVGLATRQISESEFVVIAKRGIIGNPDAAPTSVNASCTDPSTWIVAMPLSTGQAQQVYYIDLSTIITTIEDKFKSELARLKKGHEDIVEFWLQKMSGLFHAQKATLCCALTKCRVLNAANNETSTTAGFLGQIGSRLANQRSRPARDRYLSAQLEEINHNEVHQDQLGPDNLSMEDEPEQLDYSLIVDGLINAGNSKQAATIDLPVGRYVVEIVDCCIKSGQEYIGDLHIIYAQADQPQTVQFVRPGYFSSHTIAKRAYVGLTLEINHSGGPVQSYLASSLLHETSGVVTIRFTRKEQPPTFLTPNDQVDFLTCTVTATKLADYERAWISGQCCGLVLRLAGQDYIVVRRSVVGDIGCGGQEDHDFDCLAKFRPINIYPALAWPTFDGQTFVKIPSRDSFTFKMDQDMMQLAAGAMRDNLFVSLKGTDDVSSDEPTPAGPVWVGRAQRSLTRRFTTILFPVL